MLEHEYPSLSALIPVSVALMVAAMLIALDINILGLSVSRKFRSRLADYSHSYCRAQNHNSIQQYQQRYLVSRSLSLNTNVAATNIWQNICSIQLEGHVRHRDDAVHDRNGRLRYREEFSSPNRRTGYPRMWICGALLGSLEYGDVHGFQAQDSTLHGYCCEHVRGRGGSRTHCRRSLC